MNTQAEFEIVRKASRLFQQAFELWMERALKAETALRLCRPEIERQRDRCNSDDEVAPYEEILAAIDAALPQPSGEAREQRERGK